MLAVRYALDEGSAQIGRLEGDEVIEAWKAEPGGFVPSSESWERLAAADGPRRRLADVRVLAPTQPAKIVCIGLNYRDHAEETGSAIPTEPVVFAKYTSALIGQGETVVLPHDEPQPDFEAEVALVIGRRVRRVSGDEARAAIGGYTAFNDVSGRSAQRSSGGQFTRGKSFDTFAPMGPAVRCAEGVDLGALGVRCTVSGEVMQDGSTKDLIFTAEQIIEYLSAAFTLEPGDVIATGTPGGVGMGRTPPRWLRDGDVMQVEIEGVPALVNPVAAETR